MKTRTHKTMQRKPEKKHHVCYFCSHGIKHLDYKETEILGKFTSNYMRILPRKRIGTCAKHQRKLAQAIKRARFMALLPFTNR